MEEPGISVPTLIPKGFYSLFPHCGLTLEKFIDLLSKGLDVNGIFVEGIAILQAL